MLFALICEDKPDSLELRLANREKHLAYVGTLSERIRLAGPMLSDDGEGMVGSLFIIEADSADEIAAINADDPYTQAGLFGRVTIRPFRQVIPAS
ncbi:MAG: YciI family protein [Pseudomonadota bacterium]